MAAKIDIFFEKIGCPSSTSSEMLDFGSHCSTNFQPILDCFIPKFKLKYDDSENIKPGRVNTYFKSNSQSFFLGHPVA